MAQTQLPATQIKDNDIKDVDIAADAAIAFSKLAGVAESGHSHTKADIGLGNVINVLQMDANDNTWVTEFGASQTTIVDIDKLIFENQEGDAGGKASISFENFEASLSHDALTGFVINEHLDWTVNVAAKVIDDANIASDSVTQHEGDIGHNALADYNITEHRIINDSGFSTTQLYSASKIIALTGNGSDGTAIHDNVGSEILSIADKPSLEANDVFIIEDEGDAYDKKKVTFENLEATLNHDALAGFVSDEHLDWTQSYSGMRIIHNDNIGGIDASFSVLDGNGMQTHNFTFTNGVLTAYSLT